MVVLKQLKYWCFILVLSILSQVTLLCQEIPSIEQVNARINAEDGMIDPLWDNIDSFINELDYYDSNPQAPDFEVHWKGAYNKNEKELYLLISITDDSVSTNEFIHPDTSYNADHISLYIDLFADGFPHLNEANYYFLFLPYIDGYTGRIGSRSINPEERNYIEAFDKVITDEGWFVELFISLENLTQSSELNYIDTIGFDVAVSDNDLGRWTRKHRMSWSDVTSGVYANPSLLGKLVLDDKSDAPFIPNCKADFSYTDYQTSGSDEVSIQFADETETNDEIINWSWTFGDDNYTTEEDPEHSYDRIFYNTEACLFVTTKNGCNSSLCKRIVLDSRFTLEGTLNSLTNTNDSWNISAFKKDGTSFTLVDQSIMDGTAFEFTKFNEGNYLLYALPEEVDHQNLPTYFVESEKWQDADVLPISSDIFDIDINLNETKIELVGSGSISGKISKRQKGVPIILAGENRTPLNYTLTNGLGRFNITNVPFGKYIVYPEYPEWDNTGIRVDLSPDNPIAEDIVFDKNKTTSIFLNKEKEEFHVRYDKATQIIEILPRTSRNTNYSISIYTIDGKKLYFGKLSGIENTNISTRGFNSNIILVKILGDNYLYSSKLVLVVN